MHYKGLVNVPLAKLLGDQEKDKEKKKIEEKMEEEMMSDYMLDRFGGEEGRREANLQSLEEMTNVQLFKSEFGRLMAEAHAVKEKMYKNTHNRRKLAEKMYQKMKKAYV